MAKKVKITKGGETVYPATVMDAVVHPDLRVDSSKLIEEVNVSKIYPTGGTDGTNKYTLEAAIAKIPTSLRNVGIKCSFLDEAGELETWEYRGGSFTNWQKMPNGPETEKQFSDHLNRIYGIYWKDDIALLINGNEQSHTYYASTDYIPVYPGLTLNVNVTNSFNPYHNCLYDMNRKFLQTIDIIGDITIPENAYYIRICGVKSDKKSIEINNYNYPDKGELEIEKTRISENSLVASDVFKHALDLTFTYTTRLNHTDGSATGYGDCMTTDFIDVKDYDVVKVENLVCASNTESALACFYDSSKSFLSSVRYEEKGVILNKIIEIPNEASFIRIGCNTYNIPNYNGTPIVYITINENVIEDISTEVVNNSIQELDIFQNDITKKRVEGDSYPGNYALNNDGTVSNYGNCLTYGMYDVSDINYILLKNCVCASNKEVMLACFYDDNKTHIPTGNITYAVKNTVFDKLIKVPQDAKYALFGINFNNIDSYQTSSFGVYIAITLDELKKNGRPYYGQRILSLGDSYTFLNYYGPYLAKATGCTQRGRGQNGNTLRSFANDSYSTSEGTAYEPFDSSLLDNYDIVTIMGGTNDYGHGGTKLGSFETMESDAELGNKSKTIYGAVYYLIKKILTIKPSIRLYFCTQPFRLPYELNATGPGGYEENGNGLTMEKIAEAIKDVCGHFGIPVFDFYHCSGWNPWTVRFTNPESPSAGDVVGNRYTYDGLHPKDGDGNGADLLGTAFGNFINSH